jgi:hypothetical protein
MKNRTNKTQLVFKFTSFAAALVVLGACNSAGESKTPMDNTDTAKMLEETRIELEDAENDYAIKYEAFRIESEKKMAENDLYIENLKLTAKKSDRLHQEELDQKVAELETKNRTMKEKMRDYKDEGKEKWASFKEEFNHDMDELGLALKDLTKNNVK